MQPLTQEEVLEKINKLESFEGLEIGDLHFENFKIDNCVNFSEAKFIGDANFSHATFIGKADFSGANFKGYTDFSGALFKGNSNFSFATFSGEVNFWLTWFSCNADFSGATFKSSGNNADFSGAIFRALKYDADSPGVTFKSFRGDANFSLATFIGEADFSGAIFTGNAYFFYSRFHNTTTFNGVIFYNEAIFQGKRQFYRKIKVNKTGENLLVFSSEFDTDLRDIIFHHPEKIKFNSVCFEKCLIQNNFSDISKIGFYDIKWPFLEQTHLFKRYVTYKRIIYDEINSTEKDYLYLKKIYSELVKSYEVNRSFDEAEDFHYREMEMKRLSYNKFFQKFSLLSFYKYLSGYGQNVWLAIFWLLIFVILIFPLCYIHTGIENKKTSEIIEYNFSDNIQSIVTKEFWKDYWDSFGHSISVSTLKREKLFESITTSGNLFEGLQIILVSIQITLCILTLRRNFRR